MINNVDLRAIRVSSGIFVIMAWEVLEVLLASTDEPLRRGQQGINPSCLRGLSTEAPRHAGLSSITLPHVTGKRQHKTVCKGEVSDAELG